MIIRLFYNIFDVIQFSLENPFKIEGYYNENWIPPSENEKGYHKFSGVSVALETGDICTENLFKLDMTKLNLSKDEVIAEGKEFLRVFNHWLIEKLTSLMNISGVREFSIQEQLDEFFLLHPKFKHLEDCVNYSSE